MAHSLRAEKNRRQRSNMVISDLVPALDMLPCQHGSERVRLSVGLRSMMLPVRHHPGRLSARFDRAGRPGETSGSPLAPGRRAAIVSP